MTISRTLISLALVGAMSCGINGMDGKTGATGLPGPEGSSGRSGIDGVNGISGVDIVLPGPMFYPESITALSNGTLFIGSLALGQIYKFSPGAQIPVRFDDPTATPAVKQVTGVMADETAGLLYACTVDTGNAVAVTTYALQDGKVSQSYSLPGTAKCNDMVQDTAGNLFVADSTGTIYKLAKGGTTLQSWATGDMLLAPQNTGGFGADGIAYDATNKYLFVNNFEKSKLARITINTDGTAGAIDEIMVSPALLNPDGMRLIDATTLVVAENPFPPGTMTGTKGNLVKLTLDNTAKTATRSMLNNRLDGPTSFVKVGMVYWITEGQLPQLFTGMPNPNLPFLVRRLPSFE